MTAQQLIKSYILSQILLTENLEDLDELKGLSNDEQWNWFCENYWDLVHDYMTDFSYGGVPSNITPGYCGYYESESRAKNMGVSWVGWTKYYGGGKHSDPSSVEWLSDAYLLDCVEEEVTIIKQTFTKKE